MALRKRKTKTKINQKTLDSGRFQNIMVLRPPGSSRTAKYFKTEHSFETA